MLSIAAEKRPREKCPRRKQLHPPPPLQSEMLSSETEQLQEIQRGVCICRAACCHLQCHWTLPKETVCKSLETLGQGVGAEKEKGWKWGKDLTTPSVRAQRRGTLWIQRKINVSSSSSWNPASLSFPPQQSRNHTKERSTPSFRSLPLKPQKQSQIDPEAR